MLREHRRREILQAARTVFSANGYHATGVADIIAQAGIARGTFYLYFNSKREVFETLLDEFLDLLRSRVHRIDETVGLEGIHAQLRENVTGVLDAFAENPELSRIILNEAVGLDKGFDDKLSEFYQGLLDLIEQSLTLGQDLGIVRPLDTRVIAAAILGSVKEVVQRVLHGRLDRDGADDRAGDGPDGGGAQAGPDVSRVVDEVLEYNIRALFLPKWLDAGTGQGA